MKKKCNERVTGYSRCKKILLAMRLTLFFVILAVFSSSAATYGQRTKLDLNFKDKQIREILSHIEDQSKFTFMYDNNQIDVEKKVSLDVKSSTIEHILDEIFKGDGISYRLIDRHVMLFPDGLAQIKQASQQIRTITGQVTSETGEPIPGVTVVVKGTTHGTITDGDGSYSVSNVPGNAALVFSFVGMKTQEIAIAGKTEVNVTMAEDVIGIDEVVAIGYGTQRKGELTVSISQVKGDLLESIPKTSFMEALGGRAAGVDVVNSSGAPGSGSKIRIRGANSVNSGADPLYVIDGFPVAASMGDLFEGSRMGISGDQTSLLSMINPNDIESIEFLKDAAATSIYGSRGANGVVIITTKTGRQGTSNITLSVNTGIQKVANQWEMMNSTEFSNLLYDAFENGGIDMQNLGFDPANRLAIPTTYNTNWLDEVLRTGYIQDYNITFSGATAKTKFSGSAGYYDNEGIIKNNDYKRYSARLNAESKAWEDKLTAGLNANISYVDQKSISNSRVYQNAMAMTPNYPVYYPEGTIYAGYLTHYGGGDAPYDILWGDSYGVASSDAMISESPLYQTNWARNPSNQARVIANGYLSLEIIDGLVVKSSVGTDLNYSKMKYLVQSEGPYRPTGASLEHKQNQTYTWLVENTLSYSKVWGKHSLTALAGQSGQKFYAEGLGIAVEEFEAGKILVGNNPFFVDGWYFNNGIHDHLTDTHKYAKVADWTVASYFGRLNYSFDNKYLLTATVRRDGSSKFGKESKWGTFPGVSVAWNLHNEEFFDAESFDQLKIRASWGIVGNGNIPSYQSQALLRSIPSTMIGVIPAGTSTYEIGLVDAGLAWESTREVDLGVDTRIYDRVSITADAYWKKTYDLLYGFNLPESTGFSSISTTNLGSLKQFGIELSVTGDIVEQKSTGGFSWVATLNADHLQGKVTELPAKTDWVGNYIRSYLDEPIGVIYGYIVDGIYNTQAELEDTDNPYTNAQLGDYKYRDVGSIDENGNFTDVPDNNITGADRTDLGNVNPLVNLGFNNTLRYGNFDMNLLFRSSVGNKIYNQAKRDLLNTSGDRNTIKEAVDRWTPNNNNQTIQAANSNRKDPTGGAPISTFVEDGTYVRLDNLNIGYSLPSHILQGIGLKSLRIYASLNNVFVITGYSGLDPEIGGGDVLVPRGIDTNLYPKNRTFSVGLNVKF